MRPSFSLSRGLLAGACFAAVLLPARSASAQATAVAVSGTTYSQTFDSMSSIASAALPTGWSFFRSGTAASAVPVTYTSGSNTTTVTQLYTSGTPTAGGAYLWAPTASGTDKSIGFISSSSYPGPSTNSASSPLAILFGFTNTTGATITTLDLSWNYERYKQNTRTQSWEFYTSADGATWTANALGNTTYTGTGSLMYSPPESTAKAVSVPSLSISNGSNYYLRWSLVTTGSWSNSQGLGIDDVTMNLTTSGSGVSPDLYWDGGAGWTGTAPGAGGNGSWADGSGSWAPSKKANFGGTAGTVTAGTVTGSNGLTFTTSGYTLTGGTITLAGASSGLNAITTGTDGTVTTTISSAIAGSAGLQKLGQGTLVLGGANTFTGGLTLTSGTLQISADSNLGDAASPVAINSTLKTTASVSLGSSRPVSGGGTLDIAPGTTLTSSGSFAMTSVTLSNAGTLDLQGATRSVGVLTFGTAATVNGAGAISTSGLTATNVTSGTAIVNPGITFTSNGNKAVDVGSGGTLVLNGDVAGTTGRISKRGAGTLLVNGSNSTAGYQLGIADAPPSDGGTLILTTTAASGTGQLQFNYGTLQTTAPFAFANGISIGGRAGAVAVLGGTNAMTFSGSSSFYRGVGTSGPLRFDVNNATTLTGPIGSGGGGGSATGGITIGGTGTLAVNGDGSALVDSITLQDMLSLVVGGTLGGGVTVGPTNAIGGDGLINGSLAFTSGAQFIFDPAKTLTVNGAAITFGGFGVSDLRGFSPAVPDGVYPLIDGIATTTTNNLINFGTANAYGLGGGRSAYFEVLSGLSLVVVPEPSVVALAGLGLAAIIGVCRGMRRR